MQRLQREMRAEHELSMCKLQESGRRLREDCTHQVDLERSRVRQLEEERGRQQQQVGVRALDWGRNARLARSIPTLGGDEGPGVTIDHEVNGPCHPPVDIVKWTKKREKKAARVRRTLGFRPGFLPLAVSEDTINI